VPISANLKKRLVTGVLGATALVSVLVYGGVPGVALLALVISVGMVYEFSTMILGPVDHKRKTALLLFLTFLLSATAFFQELSIGIVISFLLLFLYYLLEAGKYEGNHLLEHTRELMVSFFGLFYLALLPQFLLDIRRHPLGMHWVILFFLMVWAADVGAYFAGRKWGRHKLYFRVSPGKTLEGSAGGLGCTLLVAVVYQAIFLTNLSPTYLIVAAILVNLASQVGDLCESMIKRSFNVKDSGSILPGHGGFLDRFDGVVIALPVFAITLHLMEYFSAGIR